MISTYDSKNNLEMSKYLTFKYYNPLKYLRFNYIKNVKAPEVI